jgi:ABC-type amino acid transport substrate-binding protein
MSRGFARVIAGGVALVVAASLSGCGLRVPVDPDGTLDRIDRTGMLRAGASQSEGLVEVSGDEVGGSLAELVEAFARERDADVTWVVASEERLVDALEAGDLDIAVGGMTDATPWSERASVTRGYPGVPGSEGAPVVMLLPLGENALQLALETFLDEEVGG